MAAESGGSFSESANYNWTILSQSNEHVNNRSSNPRRGRNERGGRPSRRQGYTRRTAGRGREVYDGENTSSKNQESVGYYNKHAANCGVYRDNFDEREQGISKKPTHGRSDERGRGNWRGTSDKQWRSRSRRDFSNNQVDHTQRELRENVISNGEEYRKIESHLPNENLAVSDRDHAVHGNENGQSNLQVRAKGEIIDGRYVSSRVENQGLYGFDKGANQRQADKYERRNNNFKGNQFHGRERMKRPNKWSRKPIDSEQARALMEQLVEESYECMVCCEFLRSSQSTWCCQNCYHIFHLRCIKQWVKSSFAAGKDECNGWRCPGCQNVNEKMPSIYYCFCGKVKNPEWNPRHGIIPHSCGEVCKKQRTTPPCTHFCNELCHPGPCPSCPVMVSKECPCGRTRTKMRCGQTTSLRCKNICSKILNCGKHECKQQCHEGPCSECEVEEMQSCFCGQENRQRKCGEDKLDIITDEKGYVRYSCKNICSRTLDCGNHTCAEICHAGPCESCIFLPDNVLFCPCKQTHIADLLPQDQMRKSCLDPLPCCDKLCAKKLPCGSPNDEHICKEICHTGPCGPCDGEMIVSCRCGSTKTEIPCKEYDPEKEILCQRKCNKKRKCVRHKCNQKCCIDVEHNCPLICGRKLSCGLHKCDEPCHAGNCPRCWQTSFDERTCYCGETVQYPPIYCGTPPPQCKMLCTRRHPCQHEPQHQCHNEERCPPCVVLTEKRCMCNRENRKCVPCHLTNISCGKPCGKELPCKEHKCQKLCHKGRCLAENEPCRQPCAKSRRDCPHPCGTPCHVGEECPEGPCKCQITVKCKCGRKSEKVLCLAGNSTSSYHRFASDVMGDKLRNLRSGESVDLSGLMIAEKRRGLDCDEECAKHERQKILAEAFGIDNPEANHFTSAMFSYALKEEAKAQLPLVKTIEDAIEDLVHRVKKSSLSQISHSFPPMNSSQRKLIHELAGLYNCKTISYDPEPKRNTVVTATKESIIINPKLSTVVERKINKPLPNPVLNLEERPLNFQGIQRKVADTKPRDVPVVDYFDDDFPD